MLPPSYLALLVLAACAEGALAVDDIDEMIAIIVFGVLIVIFTGIALFFLIMIIILKREKNRHTDTRRKRQRDILRINTQRGELLGYKPRPESRRLRTVSEGSTNTNPSTVNYSFVHQTSHDPLLSSTTSSFRQVYNGGYDNQAYSSQLSQSSETTITICTPTPGAGLSTLHESHDSSSSPPDYYQLYNGHKPPSSSDVTMAVSSSSEEKEQLSTSPEIEKQPLPLSAEAAEQNGTPPQLHQSNGDSNTLEHAHAEAENQPHPPAAEKNPDQSVDDQQPHPLVTEKNPHPPADEKQPHPSPAEKNSHPSTDVKQPHPSTETLEHNGSPPQTESSNINSTRETPATHTATNAVTNGTAAGADNLTATNTVDEKTREKIYPKTKKKGIMKGLFSKEKPRRGSEKPLLYSQSSVTTPTPVDSPPQGKIFNRAESDIFYEEDEHQHEEDTKITMNANGMFITPIEETSL